MTLSPLIIEVDLEPGDSRQEIITLYNETGEDLYLQGFISSFRPKGERGEAEIISDFEGAARFWLALPISSVFLKPGEAINLPLEINVPPTAAVGGYYLAVIWQGTAGPATGQTTVGLSGQVGTLVLIRVTGELSENLIIKDFSLFQEGRIFHSLPVGFSARLENQGNIHLKPGGYIIIKNIFGRLSAILPFNQIGGNILPQSIRRFEDFWSRSGNYQTTGSAGFFVNLKNEWRQFALGRFSAQLVVEYGQPPKQTSSEKIFFWVWPWRMATLFLILVILIMLFWFRHQAGRRKENL